MRKEPPRAIVPLLFQIRRAKLTTPYSRKKGIVGRWASESKKLTREEFTSLLAVGETCAVLEPPAVIPAEHSARLIALGYMAELSGRLRMTTSGRLRIAAGFENRPPLISN
jgi:hypothetical protein